ncbi:short chain dehydrogenase reductase [Plectosphaerella cucumerina]|uniref:Short chain dehydrogenase reductase n=1 Tax=Plectosphaerella cucumerina TaxID=40658 RepID=A0A8K0TTA5_9PEZI|nr:short chain dehydrogenase reductase [Plectosphaerella cucumerina]
MSEEIHTGFYFTSVRHHDTYPAIDPRKRDFSGRYVFITGASKGIGRETALAYAAAGAAGIGIGARTDLSDLVPLIAEAARAAGRAAPQVEAVELDVTDEVSVGRAAAAIAKAFPRLDILINNAGYLEKRAKIADSDPREWLKTWSVNVTGPYLVSRAFLPQILDPARGGDKTIVNLGSIAAHLVAPGASAYQTSKLAVQRFTEFLDADHGPDGLLTYVIHPGGVATEMGLRLPVERQVALTETPKLCADTLVFLTEKRREWLAARYLSATWDVEELLSKEEEVVKGGKLKVRMIV